MNDQGLSPVAPAALVDEDDSLPILTNGHHNGFDELRKTFAENRPVAIVFGESRFRPSFLVDRFFAECEDNVGQVRITNPGSDREASVRDVALGFGFDLQDVSLAGLEQEIRNFLAYQKGNNRRTVVCFEEVQHDSRQALEIALRLAELEAKEEFGLMLILSGPPSLNDLLGVPPLDALSAMASERIALGPFSLAETRGHILRAVEAAGFSDFSRVFEYDSITCIHEICSGVPERVEALCCECIEKTVENGGFPITAEMVSKTGDLLWREHQVQPSEALSDGKRVNGAKGPIGRLIARMHGVVLKEQTLSHGHILIGRGPLCDIAVTNPLVSRHHALVVRSDTGASLIDLGSTNGTFIDGRPVDQHDLQHGDEITIGDCRISYLACDD
jgi:type II secretory pathway predicted ATPase ExeA